MYAIRSYYDHEAHAVLKILLVQRVEAHLGHGHHLAGGSDDAHAGVAVPAALVQGGQRWGGRSYNFV